MSLSQWRDRRTHGDRNIIDLSSFCHLFISLFFFLLFLWSPGAASFPVTIKMSESWILSWYHCTCHVTSANTQIRPKPSKECWNSFRTARMACVQALSFTRRLHSRLLFSSLISMFFFCWFICFVFIDLFNFTASYSRIYSH